MIPRPPGAASRVGVCGCLRARCVAGGCVVPGGVRQEMLSDYDTKKRAVRVGTALGDINRVDGLFHEFLESLGALTNDVEAVFGIGYAYALKVEVFDGSVFVNGDVGDTC